MAEAKIKSENFEHQKIINKVYEYGQEQILKFWNELTEDEQYKLINQIKTIDFELISNLYNDQVKNPKEDEEQKLEPCDVIDVPKDDESLALEAKAKTVGEKAIRANKVAVFLVAGGQGSRLGFDGPKGCYKVSPVKNKTIFQLHAERIKAYQKKYKAIIPWYIMTSEVNHKATKEYFEDNDFFGLNVIHFFKQGMIPAVNPEGKYLMASKSEIFMNPDGHGGCVAALKKSGALDDMKKRGVEYISYFQVDNILVKPVDPVFIGYHIQKEAQMSCKVLEKRDPDEGLGVIGKVNGKQGIIEYTVISDELKNKRDPDGSLAFKAGNIAIHVINRDFFDELASEKMSLPFYKAHKKVPYINDNGEKVNPQSPNAYKFEKFVFDALQKTTNSVTMMTKREEEFAPVKNAEGQDSPQTAKDLMSNLFKSWFQKAGVTVADVAIIEINWQYALDADEFAKKIKGKEANLPFDYENKLYLE